MRAVECPPVRPVKKEERGILRCRAEFHEESAEKAGVRDASNEEWHLVVFMDEGAYRRG